MKECIAFAEAAGFISPEEAKMIRKTGGQGPGGCPSEEECITYCSDPTHFEECGIKIQELTPNEFPPIGQPLYQEEQPFQEEQIQQQIEQEMQRQIEKQTQQQMEQYFTPLPQEQMSPPPEQTSPSSQQEPMPAGADVLSAFNIFWEILLNLFGH